MTVRRRSRRRPLSTFSSRSPLHALIAGLLRLVLLVGISVIGYIVIVNVLAPTLVDSVVHQAQSR